MVTRTSVNGKSEQLKRDNGKKAFLLYDFDIEGSTVKSEHMRILREIAKTLEKGGGIDIIGMTDRTGSESLNGTLSNARARSALAYLKQILRPKGIKDIKVGMFKGMGTAVAVQQKQPANTLNEQYRCVYVEVSDDSDPPPPPKPQEIKLPDGKKMLDSIQPDLSPLGDTLADTFSKVLDTGSPILDAIGLLAGSELLPAIGGILGGLSALISTPLAWSGQDRVARINGYIDGLAWAYDDMAAKFKDSSLETKPLDQWPAIPTPVAHTPKTDPVSAMDRAHMGGQLDGCNDAWKAVRALEMKPGEYKTKDGKTIQVTGKIFLRALYVSTGGNVKEGIIKVINQQLKKAGHREYPTY